MGSTPKHEPLPRLMRPVSADELPPGMLAVYDEALNLVRYNKALYDLLDKQEQKEVLRTERDLRAAVQMELPLTEPAEAPDAPWVDWPGPAESNPEVSEFDEAA